MFYFPAVLNLQTGCFSTIWLVATNGKKVSKREYLKVNVPETCDQLIDYILVRVPAPRPDLPQPRLSFYLASLLQYGVIKTYHRQVDIHFKETRDVIECLYKFSVKEKIDMGKPGRDMTNKNAMLVLEDNEWANDPLFGEMLSISPSARFHPEWSPTLDTSITAHPATIRLKEPTSAVMPQTEWNDGFGDNEDITKALLVQASGDFFFDPESEQINNIFYQIADPIMCGDVWANPKHLFTRPCNILHLSVMPLWNRVAVIHSYADLQSEKKQESSGYSSSDQIPSDENPPQSNGDIHEPEMPSPLKTSPVVNRMEEFMRNFEELDEARVTLKSMLPIHSRRREMASAFMMLLERVTGRKMKAEQKEPYDEIWISIDESAFKWINFDDDEKDHQTPPGTPPPEEQVTGRVLEAEQNMPYDEIWYSLWE